MLAAHVWTGAGDGLHWSDPSNWDGSAPASAESNVTLDFPADNQPLTLDNDISGLTLQSVMVEGAYTVNGNGVSLGGSIATGGFAVTWTAPITLTSDATLDGSTMLAPSPADFTITAPVSGTGNLTIAAGSSVNFASSTNNTYSGATIVDGTLNLDSSAPGIATQVGASFQSGGAAIPHDLTIDTGGAVNTQTSDQLATSGDVTVNTGGILTLGGTTDMIHGLSGDGTLAGDGTLVIIGVGGFSGPIGGSVSILAGANASSVFESGVGWTTGTFGQISGALSLNNVVLPNAQFSDLFDSGDFGSALYRGWVGRLSGGGTIGSLLAHSEFVQPGGTSLPPLTVLGDVALDSPSTLQFNTGLGSTQTIIAGGTVTLGGGTFSLLDGFVSGDARPIRGTIYTLIDNRGPHPIAGTFNGLPNGSLIVTGPDQWRINYNGGDGNDVILTYLGRDTSVTVSSDASPAVFGHAGLHAAVTLNVGTADVPLTGAVTFYSDGAAIGSAMLDQNAVATLNASTLSAGFHRITAAYSGDADEYQPSTSPGALHQQVTLATPAVTLTAPASVMAASPGTITVAVGQTDAPGVVPHGQAMLDVDGSPIASAPLDGSGNAVFSTRLIPAGPHQLSATYGGDTDFAAATATPATITVLPQISVANATATVPASETENLVFPVTLGAASSVPVTVSYSTQDGSAQAGTDYVAISGTLTFAPGQTSLSVSVQINGRANWQTDLTLSLVLSSPVNASLGASLATGTIQSADDLPPAGLAPDELNQAQGDLIVEGTAGNDIIVVRPTKVAGEVQVVVNNAIVATDSGIARVIVYGGAGNDRITADPKLPVGVAFFGGDGNDTLTGGAANDILVGGAGSDTLIGSNGMNLLVGGDGADRLKGSRLGDILAGGATPYDAGRPSDLFKLESLLAAWTSGAPYASRVAEISSSMPSGWNLNAALTSDSSLRDAYAGVNSRTWLVRTLTAEARRGHHRLASR